MDDQVRGCAGHQSANYLIERYENDQIAYFDNEYQHILIMSIEAGMEELFAYIDGQKDRFVDELRAVCRQPSISATGEGILEMAAMLQDIFTHKGAQAQIIDTTGNPILYATFPGRGNKVLMFYNHYDVQPAGDLAAWESDPFEAEIRSGTIFSRGVADNKGNIMCRLLAVEALQAIEAELPASIKFVIEGEEEIGSPNLESAVEAHSGLFQADGIVWEGGFKDFDERPEMYLGVKGWCGVELRAKRAKHELHSSFATIAPNPIWDLIHTLQSLRSPEGEIQIEGFWDDIVSPSPEEIEIAEAIPYDWQSFYENAAIVKNKPSISKKQLIRSHLFQPTCNIIGIEGGYVGTGAKTVLPHEASAKIGFRLLPDQDPEDILRKIENHIKANALGDIQVNKLGSINRPYKSPLNSKISKATILSSKDAYGRKPVIYPIAAGTGSVAKLAKKLNIPAVLVGCANAWSNMHAPNENLRIDKDYIPGLKHMAALIRRFSDME